MKPLHFLLASSLLLNASTFGLAAYGTFRDVPGSAWYAPAVNHLAELNILQGDPDGNYRPTKAVNRAELAIALDPLLEYEQTGKVAGVGAIDPIALNVPFTSQAPTGDWRLPYKEACEEASLIMVRHFLQSTGLDARTADREILDLVNWEEQNGYGVDVSVSDLAAIAQKFYGLKTTTYFDDDVTIEKLKNLLNAGNPVIIPTAGRILANPNYTAAGPPYHMIVLIGYDENGFLAHDPGVGAGASYRYPFGTIDAAIHDWTGDKDTVAEKGRRALLVIND